MADVCNIILQKKCYITDINVQLEDLIFMQHSCAVLQQQQNIFCLTSIRNTITSLYTTSTTSAKLQAALQLVCQQSKLTGTVSYVCIPSVSIVFCSNS